MERKTVYSLTFRCINQFEHFLSAAPLAYLKLFIMLYFDIVYLVPTTEQVIQTCSLVQTGYVLEWKEDQPMAILRGQLIVIS